MIWCILSLNFAADSSSAWEFSKYENEILENLMKSNFCSLRSLRSYEITNYKKWLNFGIAFLMYFEAKTKAVLIEY